MFKGGGVHPTSTLKGKRACQSGKEEESIYHFYVAFQRRRLLGGLGTEAGGGLMENPRFNH